MSINEDPFYEEWARHASADEPAPTNGNRASGPVPAELVDYVRAELGVDSVAAIPLAESLETRYRNERIGGLAKRLVRDEQLTRDARLDQIDTVTADELLKRDRPPRVRVYGDLLLEGHNAIAVAAFKVGKSTLIENMAVAAVTGSNLFGRFPVDEPLRVALFNYELDERDMDDRIRAFGLTDDEYKRLLIVNLRGQRLPLMTTAGRDWAVRTLAAHHTDIWFPDPFGAAFTAAGGESENDNAEVRRFTTALDEIKRLASCPTLVMPVHTGRAEQVEGAERGRGATVLDDWPDVRILLTRDEDEHRYIRTDGRAWSLHESRLGFDPTSRLLTLSTADMGTSRRQAQAETRAGIVARAVTDEPGITKTALRDAVHAAIKNTDDKSVAIRAAITARLIHTHDGRGTTVHHYPGPSHPGEDCPYLPAQPTPARPKLTPPIPSVTKDDQERLVNL